MVFISGFAALSWEVLWQLKTSLAVGVSALGTAITLAVTMSGMFLGSLAAGRLLRNRASVNPLRSYGLLEGAIGLSGLLMPKGFSTLEALDTLTFRHYPNLCPLLQLVGVSLILGLPTMAMGATIPILGAMSRQYRIPLSTLYGLNTAGAALGCLAIAFELLPSLGVKGCTLVLAGLNLSVAGVAWLLKSELWQVETTDAESTDLPVAEAAIPRKFTLPIVFLTGFVTFALEVSWFRSLRAAFFSTSESFAIMLSTVLLALALGARLCRYLRLSVAGLSSVLVFAGVAIIAATPLVERFDRITPFGGDGSYLVMLLTWGTVTFVVLGPPMTLLGMVMPRVLEAQRSTSAWARVYAINTLGAVAGALSAAWLLLPALGAITTALALGFLTLVAGVLGLRPAGRLAATLVGLVSLGLAYAFGSGVGVERVQGRLSFEEGEYRILRTVETPDSTISALELTNGKRLLLIDGFETADEREGGSFYMEWMGRLPMILHPDPKRALVICFGTGQTTNGVRREGAEEIDLVDLNAEVLKMEDLFPSNEGVLQDPRVHPHVMDGRAWMRRTNRRYEVITLEPMPPNFAGVNALYSEEFYRLAYEKLEEGGVLVQWLPFHIVSGYHSASIARTAKEVFPNSALWIDPLAQTGIVVCRKGGEPIGLSWSGLERKVERSLTNEQIKNAMYLTGPAFDRYAALGDVITDNNQLLNHGLWRARRWSNQKGTNLAAVHWASTDPPPPVLQSQAVVDRVSVDRESLREVPPWR